MDIYILTLFTSNQIKSRNLEYMYKKECKKFFRYYVQFFDIFYAISINWNHSYMYSGMCYKYIVEYIDIFYWF